MKCDEKNYECDDCPICLKKINDKMKTTCGHVFCAPCIQEWNKIKNVCPMCVQDLYF